jgi:hypothetical protein
MRHIPLNMKPGKAGPGQLRPGNGLTLCPQEYSVARIENAPASGGNLSRLRAADDFASTRARLEELRRDRAKVWAGNDPSVEPRASTAGNKPSSEEKPGLSPAIRRVLFRSAAKPPAE